MELSVQALRQERKLGRRPKERKADRKKRRRGILRNFDSLASIKRAQEQLEMETEEDVAPIEKTLRPLIYVSWFLGVGAARPTTWPKVLTVASRLVHFGVCTVIVTYGAIDFFTFGSVFKSDIYKIMYYTNKVACYVSSYYYVYHGIRHYEKWPRLLNKMEHLNEKMRKEISSNDRATKYAEILAIVTVLLLGPISLVVHALYYHFVHPEDIFASDLLLYYTIAQSTVNSFVFDIVVYAICQTFRKINKLIERMDAHLHVPSTVSKIRRIRKLHSDVCELVTLVNDIHGVQLLLCSANSFTMVVATLFRIYMGVVERNYAFMLINNVIWMIYAGQFGCNCWVCTLTHRESARTGILVHKTLLNRDRLSDHDESATLSIDDKRDRRQASSKMTDGSPPTPCRLSSPHCLPPTTCLRHLNLHVDLNRVGATSPSSKPFERDCVRNELNDFSSQLQHQQVSFTACDFFQINNSLLTSFVGVITTYLIILVQFYTPENSKLMDTRQDLVNGAEPFNGE